MTASARQAGLRAKTRRVVDHHYDTARPGKPLYLLIPGGLIAVAALGLIIYILYLVFVQGDAAGLDQQKGLTLVALLAPVYIGGVFLFSYGYELYNMRKAFRLTAIVVLTTLAVVIIVAVLFVLLGDSGSSSSGRSSSSSSSSKSGGQSSHASAPSGAASSPGTSAGTHASGGWGSSFVGINVPGRTVREEVVHEVPVGLKPVTCPSCGRAYAPAENRFACPNCGAATPGDLVAQSRGGEDAAGAQPGA